MKKLITICLLLTSVFSSQAQEKQNDICDCPAPERVDYAKISRYIRDKEKSLEASLTFLFEEHLLKMSCVDLKNDTRETIIQKVNCMWNIYKTKFACDSLEFNVPNGNVLKFAMNFNFPDAIYLLVDHYGLDVTFIDPADGLSFIGYLDQEISKTKKFGPGKIEEMIQVKKDVLMEMKYNPKTKEFEPVK